MKKQIIYCSTLLLLAGGSFAVEFKPYIGLDSSYNNNGMKKDYGSKIFDKSSFSHKIYVGAELHKNFAVELNYDQGMKANNKDAEYSTGDPIFPGSSTKLGSGEFNKYDTSYKIKGSGISFVGLYPLNEKVKLFAAADISFLKFNGNYTNTENEQGSASVRRTFSSSTKMIPGIRVGTTYNLTEHFGVKGFAGWKNTSRFKNIKSAENTNIKVSMNDTYFAGVGIFYNI